MAVNGVLEVSTFNSVHSHMNFAFWFSVNTPGTSPTSASICAPLHIPRTGLPYLTQSVIPLITGVMAAIAPALK
jgi:hypothetical protein